MALWEFGDWDNLATVPKCGPCPLILHSSC